MGYESFDVVVDLSNVCRDEGIPPRGRANLARFDQVVDACRLLMGSDIKILAIADDSLAPRLGREDKRRLKEMQRDGLVETAPKADLLILRTADRHGAVVISHDKFKDHRKEFPWIADAGGRFWGWEVVRGGQVAIRERQMRRYTDFELSRTADRDDLEGLFHLSGDRLEEVLTHRWECPNAGCLSRALPDNRRPLPIWDGGRLLCSACRSPVEKGEPRPRAIELKFGNVDGLEERRTIEAGSTLTLGRDESDLDLTDLAGADIGKVSGTHCRFEFDGRDWFVTDLGSTNGTWLGDWDARRDERKPFERLTANTPVRLGERSRVSIGDVIRVDRSGKLSVRS